MLFVVDQGWIHRMKYNTVEGKLAAIRWAHIKAGFGDPTANAPLVKYAIKALKRIQGEDAPKQPVTPAMLRAARGLLDRSKAHGCALWAALLMGFGFLMRAGEYLAYDDQGTFDLHKALMWEDVVFLSQGEEARVGQEGVRPDEVRIKFRGSKTDQYRSGCVRNLFATGLDDLCTVEALWKHAHMVGGSHLKGPVMEVPGETAINRADVTDILRKAAKEVGADSETVCTHSLRAGGATALYAAGYSDNEIQYQGRWNSDCWKRYVHRIVAKAGPLARDMFVQQIVLLRHQAATGRRRMGEKEKGTPVPPQERRDGGPRSPVERRGLGVQAPINRAYSSARDWGLTAEYYNAYCVLPRTDLPRPHVPPARWAQGDEVVRRSVVE